MNYHEARQTKDKSGWDWTTMNDGQIWRSGACADHGPGGHATREEAERHFYDGEAAKVGEVTYTTASVCEVHPDVPAPWTPTAVESHMLGSPVYFCDECRSRFSTHEAIWRTHNPFTPGISITASW